MTANEIPRTPGVVTTVVMLVASNLFMTFAWYWHLRKGASDGKPLALIVLMSWGIALLEYSIMVPANRLGAAAGLSARLPTAVPRRENASFFSLTLPFFRSLTVNRTPSRTLLSFADKKIIVNQTGIIGRLLLGYLFFMGKAPGSPSN